MENAQEYLTATPKNTSGTWGQFEGTITFNSDNTSCVVVLTLPKAAAGDKDGTFTLTFEKISDTEKSREDKELISKALENMSLTVSAATPDELATALKDELDAVKTWGSTVTVDSCRLANGESHTGGTKSVQLTYTITVGTETISATSYISVTVSIAP